MVFPYKNFLIHSPFTTIPITMPNNLCVSQFAKQTTDPSNRNQVVLSEKVLISLLHLAVGSNSNYKKSGQVLKCKLAGAVQYLLGSTSLYNGLYVIKCLLSRMKYSSRRFGSTAISAVQTGPIGLLSLSLPALSDAASLFLERHHPSVIDITST